MRILAGSLFFGTIAQAVLAEPLPFRDGRYLTDARLCGLTDEQLLARVGDDIYTVLVDITGSTLNEGYGAYCDVLDVWRTGDAVEFVASCDSEGETNEIEFSYTFISPTSFRIQGHVYERCG